MLYFLSAYATMTRAPGRKECFMSLYIPENYDPVLTVRETQEAIKYISMKLDENERSTQIRLMKVKDMVLEEAHRYSERQ